MIALDTCKYLTCHRQISYASFVEVSHGLPLITTPTASSVVCKHVFNLSGYNPLYKKLH